MTPDLHPTPAAAPGPGPDPAPFGECPRCGAPLVPRSYYVWLCGYLTVLDCSTREGEHACTYRRTL